MNRKLVAQDQENQTIPSSELRPGSPRYSQDTKGTFLLLTIRERERERERDFRFFYEI